MAYKGPSDPVLDHIEVFPRRHVVARLLGFEGHASIMSICAEGVFTGVTVVSMVMA